MKKIKANYCLLARGYDIIDAKKVKQITKRALRAGAFVQGYDRLMELSNEWIENEYGEMTKEFYHRTENNPHGEYAKAVALFEGDEIFDFYVINSDSVEI